MAFYMVRGKGSTFLISWCVHVLKILNPNTFLVTCVKTSLTVTETSFSTYKEYAEIPNDLQDIRFSSEIRLRVGFVFHPCYNEATRIQPSFH